MALSRKQALKYEVMPNCFEDCIANTREDFFSLVGNASLLFYEVYDKNPSEELEAEFGTPEVDERCVRLDLGNHAIEARERFCSLSEIECQAYGWPNTRQKPVPYLGAFVPGIGFIDTAFSVDEVGRVVEKARHEKRIIASIRS